MLERRTFRLIIAIGLVALLSLPTLTVLADGTETLGPPSIPIANGSGHVAAGTGLIDQPGTININVPVASAGQINQVLLYWEGHAPCNNAPLGNADDCQVSAGVRAGQNINVNGNAITGQLIGGPTHFYTLPPPQWSLSYRADITELELVAPGANVLTVSGVSFDINNPDGGLQTGFANGASVVVIYDDGSFATVGIRDGNDNAFHTFASPLDTTVPQTFTFAAESQARTADLTLLVGSVESPEASPIGPRPTRITVEVNGAVQHFDNLLASGDGPTWDTLNLPIEIPADATSLTVRILSFDDGSGNVPASLSWVAAALSVPITPTPNGVGVGTPGYWMNHPEAWPEPYKTGGITIGGVHYTQAEAIAVMKAPSKGNKLYDMFSHLVAAKLNVANGAESSCINDTIAAGDAWMTTHGGGKKLNTSGEKVVRANSEAWKAGEPLKNTLDAYNNGLLCAPPRN